MINMRFYDNKGVNTYVCNDPCDVFERLSNELIAKKINACTYIKRIKREPDYSTGGHIITVFYAPECGGGKSVYHTK